MINHTMEAIQFNHALIHAIHIKDSSNQIKLVNTTGLLEWSCFTFSHNLMRAPIYLNHLPDHVLTL